MMHRLIIGWLLAVAAMPSITGVAHAQRKQAVRTQIFKSQRAVARALGSHVAQQIPAAFDFGLHALVWVDQPVGPKPRLQIVTLPAERPLHMKPSTSLMITATRRARALSFALIWDSPCSGGAPRPPEMMKRCNQRVMASWAAAKKVLRLFATPRYRLRRATAARQAALPRP